MTSKNNQKINEGRIVAVADTIIDQELNRVQHARRGRRLIASLRRIGVLRIIGEGFALRSAYVLAPQCVERLIACLDDLADRLERLERPDPNQLSLFPPGSTQGPCRRNHEGA